LALFIIFLFTFKRESKPIPGLQLPKTSIIVPAFNEEVSIVNCVKMLRRLNFPDFEIIVINDGSTDKTSEALLGEFDLKQTDHLPQPILRTQAIGSIFTDEQRRLTLVNKSNGGKADSINAGINLSDGELICTIDADSILDKDSLARVVQEMVTDNRVFVVGGQIAVANDTVIENGKVINAKMPSNPLVLWQITEYIKSFLVSRLGLSKLNSILIMAGAFSVFRRNDLVNAGGFLTASNDSDYLKSIFGESRSTVCEDMEIVVRLWGYYHERRQKGKAVYLSKPLCWTEVPENLTNLFKQRARWHLGLAESISLHSRMIFDPLYKATGLLAMPYYLFFELISPVIKIAALIFIIYVASAGLINTQWVLLMAILITATAALITSMVTVLIENWSEKQSAQNRSALRYKSFADWLRLLFFSIIADFSYAFFRIAAQVKGLVDFSRRKSEWNKFERKGLKSVESALTNSKL
jgi:cellulose synthase/poly-beta-1,6-N-acetylglucosamine synthase-like glycosyltransferase